MRREPNRWDKSDYEKRKAPRMYHGMPPSFYKSKRWKQAAALAYNRDRGYCQMCGQLAYQHNIDHIIPIAPKSSDRLKYDLSNLQTLCISCHNEKGKHDKASFILNESKELGNIFANIKKK